jgi:microcin C transport system ATP-binding protein
VQAQMVELLRDLQARHGIAYLFISHDLRVVKALAHDIMVMRDGKIVESGTAAAVFAAPQTAYARALMAAAFEIEIAEPQVLAT